MYSSVFIDNYYTKKRAHARFFVIETVFKNHLFVTAPIIVIHLFIC